MDDCASWRVSTGSRSMSAARTGVTCHSCVRSWEWSAAVDMREGLLGMSPAREPSLRDSHIYEQRPWPVVLKMACMLSSQWICWGRRVNLVAVSYSDPVFLSYSCLLPPLNLILWTRAPLTLAIALMATWRWMNGICHDTHMEDGDTQPSTLVQQPESQNVNAFLLCAVVDALIFCHSPLSNPQRHLQLLLP